MCRIAVFSCLNHILIDTYLLNNLFDFLIIDKQTNCDKYDATTSFSFTELLDARVLVRLTNSLSFSLFKKFDRNLTTDFILGRSKWCDVP